MLHMLYIKFDVYKWHAASTLRDSHTHKRLRSILEMPKKIGAHDNDTFVILQKLKV